ncbi:hypothetical protein BO71DRAFT_394050 [Aspergillus ellipticus CBS 707.79]|uniref:Tat pathway signal sequence n=1 Tax=Aspergillus ellipticus CBS 707.79 TaxID=1448320 RepID=A0A319DQ34_9EURO|nr:hypothetical protein BO71DRAFT_394050 [Aspergillus ellipticus CBS 707.79]
MHIPVSNVRRNGSLVLGSSPSIYRQDPSPEVDAAWLHIANINPIAMTEDEVRSNGFDPNVIAEWPEEYGFGPGAYIGRLDVFHELHCLDVLRREVHYDHYYPQWPKSEGGAPEDHKVHISHCIYNLLQNIMCTASTDPFVHYWVDVNEEPYPDFSINRQCRDFESVLNWQIENSVPMRDYRDIIHRPEGVKTRIMSDEYKQMIGWFEKNGITSSSHHHDD